MAPPALHATTAWISTLTRLIPTPETDSASDTHNGQLHEAMKFAPRQGGRELPGIDQCPRRHSFESITAIFRSRFAPARDKRATPRANP